MATCGIVGFDGILDNVVLPLSIQASILTSIIIAITYMVGNAISHPKLLTWSKTEIVQVFVSISSIVLLTMIMTSFCSINVNDLGSLFGISGKDVNLYQSAQAYLTNAAHYSHNAITVIRYHLEAYSVLSALNKFECDFNVGGIGLGCLFGYSGVSYNPLGGYGVEQASLNLFFNSAIFSYFSAMNFLFILLFVYKGFVLLFLPLGVFLRSMPYMRSFGSLLIAVAISFLTVYPFMLSLFDLMSFQILDQPFYAPQDLVTYDNAIIDGKPGFKNIALKYDESVFIDKSETWQSIASAFSGTDYIVDTYFPKGQNPIGAVAFGAYAFVACVFLPTAAMLATLAAVAYLAKFYGEEIDLSRILQMV